MSEPKYIEQEVEQTMEDPESGEVAELVIGYKGDEGKMRRRLTDIEATILEHFGFKTFLVEVDEEKISELASLEGIESVEFNQTFEIL